MIAIVFLLFAAAIIIAILTIPTEERKVDMTITEKLEFIKTYAEGLESDYKLGKVTDEEYRDEIAWLDERLNLIEQDIMGGEKDLAECPELAEMGKLKDNFFSYLEGIKK